MNKFKNRSIKEELLDQDNLLREDLFQNLNELEVINRLLGGHQTTLRGIKKLVNDRKRTYKIVDFACGGGDTLRFLSRWAKKEGYQLQLKGFDILEDAIIYAKTKSVDYHIDWGVADFTNYNDPDCDIAICSLACHHFYDEKLKNFLQKMVQTAKLGVIINDLHRHPLAYYGISFLSYLFSKSHLVKHDARLSVLKGFKKQEWQELLYESKLQRYHLQWVWAFRHLLILYP